MQMESCTEKLKHNSGCLLLDDLVDFVQQLLRHQLHGHEVNIGCKQTTGFERVSPGPEPKGISSQISKFTPYK